MKRTMLSLALLSTIFWLYNCKTKETPDVIRLSIEDVLGVYTGYLTYEKVDSTGAITFQEQQADTINVSKLTNTSVKMDSKQMGIIVSMLNANLASETNLPYSITKQSFKGFLDPTGNGLYISSDTILAPAFHKGSITTCYFNINEGFIQQKKYARYKIAALLK